MPVHVFIFYLKRWRKLLKPNHVFELIGTSVSGHLSFLSSGCLTQSSSCNTGYSAHRATALNLDVAMERGW